MAKKFFYTITLLGLTLGFISSAYAQVVTSTNMSFNPVQPSADVGQPWSTTVTVTDPSTGQALSGSIWIDKITKASDSSTAYDAGTSPNKVTLSATGQGILTYALSPAGSYTVDVCYQQSPSTGCVDKTRAFVVSIGTPPATTPTPTTSPSSTGTTSSSGDATVTIPNPIACNDATCLISQVIRYILGIIAIIATLMFVWGGVMMLTSAGNSDRVKRAKETLAWAAIGIVVILLSWGIIRFVLAGLLNTTTNR